MGRNLGKPKVLYFKEDEWELIQEKAATVKLDTTKYIKRMAIKGYIVEYNLEILNDFIYELNKIGVNVNQITKKVNETGNIHAGEMEIIQDDIKRIWKAIEKSLGSL